MSSRQAIQPRCPAEVVSVDVPHVLQTCTLLLTAGITICTSYSHRLAQIAQLFIDIARVDHHAAYFFPQNRTIPRTHTCHVLAQSSSREHKPLTPFSAVRRTGRI